METALHVEAVDADDGGRMRVTISAVRELVGAQGRLSLSMDQSIVGCGDEVVDEPWSLAAAPLGPRGRPHPLEGTLSAGGVMSSSAVFERVSFVHPGIPDVVEIPRQTTVLAADTVTVPAGVFQAIRLRHTDAVPGISLPGGSGSTGGSVVMDDWLVEGIGLVRRVVHGADGSVAAEQVLLEHVPPS